MKFLENCRFTAGKGERAQGSCDFTVLTWSSSLYNRSIVSMSQPTQQVLPRLESLAMNWWQPWTHPRTVDLSLTCSQHCPCLYAISYENLLREVVLSCRLFSTKAMHLVGWLGCDICGTSLFMTYTADSGTFKDLRQHLSRNSIACSWGGDPGISIEDVLSFFLPLGPQTKPVRNWEATASKNLWASFSCKETTNIYAFRTVVEPSLELSKPLALKTEYSYTQDKN